MPVPAKLSKHITTMKTNLITIAAMLTMLIALGGCDFSSNKDANVANEGNTTQLNWTLDQYLFHAPVEQASGNTLGNTPSDIENLVSGFDIDVRNSAYNILQNVKKGTSYTYATNTKQAKLYFAMTNILYPVITDAGVSNAMAKDYNDCVKSIGVERLNKGEGRQCSEGWGRSWKSQVVDKVLASSSLQNSLYEWIKPELKRVMNALNNDQRTYMKNALSHMIAYTDNYNHQAEKKFYRDCCNSSYGEQLFVHTGRIVDMSPVDDEVTNPYRFLESWVYRRVEEGSMTASHINGWLRKIKGDAGF